MHLADDGIWSDAKRIDAIFSAIYLKIKAPLHTVRTKKDEE
jgi:hypothetical protein